MSSLEGGFPPNIKNRVKYLKVQKHFPNFSGKIVDDKLVFTGWPCDGTGTKKYSLKQLLQHCDALEAADGQPLALPVRVTNAQNRTRRQKRERQGSAQQPWASGHQGHALSAQRSAN